MDDTGSTLQPGAAPSEPPSSIQPSKNSALTYQYNLWVSHSVLMAVGFGFLLPIGALCPVINYIRHRPNNLWFKLHRTIQSIFFLLGWTGFLIAMFNIAMADGNLQRMTTLNVHGPLGIALIVIVTVQFTLGVCRPHLPPAGQEKSLSRVAFEAIHPQMGHCIVVIAAVQIWYGYGRLNTYIGNSSTRNAITIWAYVHVIGMPVLFFTVVFWSKYRAGKLQLWPQAAHTNPNPPPPPQGNEPGKPIPIPHTTTVQSANSGVARPPGEADKYHYQPDAKPADDESQRLNMI
jgi:cytochrome b561